MNEQEKTVFLQGAQLALMAAQEEIRDLPGNFDYLRMIDAEDNGSPWARAFLRCCEYAKKDIEDVESDAQGRVK